jgi:signal transduction histidine kinase
LVQDRTKEIEEKNKILLNQTFELNETNALLEERQQYIEEQSEELKRKADELFEKNRTLITLNATKDKFFTIIAHDLKNPFNAILGFSELLSIHYNKYDDAKRMTLISAIFDSSTKVFKLLENLLQWARSQTDNIEFKPEGFYLNEIIDTNIVLVDDLVKEKNLVIIRECNENIKIYADRNMISTVIRNLITNAIKFSENGTIEITCEQQNSLVTLKVKDSGIGINPEKLKGLFNIEGSKSTQGTRGESGTGLGLILCKEFIIKNKGTIHAESEFGKGSTFYFILPVKQE